MLQHINRVLRATFCTNSASDKLSMLRIKQSSGEKLHDHQYSNLIEDLLKKKQSLSAYNMLIQSYLDNVLLDKQIFTKVEKSLGQLQDTYKNVLTRMYSKYFPQQSTKQNTNNQEPTNKDNETQPNSQSLSDKVTQKHFKMLKQGQQLLTSIFNSSNCQKITLKNVVINFDHTWISQYSKLGQVQETSNEQQTQLQGDDILVSQSQQISEQQQQKFGLADVLRSVKSVDIGEIQIATDTKLNK